MVLDKSFVTMHSKQTEVIMPIDGTRVPGLGVRDR